ncbi:hypothetical protein PCCS19_15410 [Paenibacillus sp. CCS19]|uniref:hypothetical protein n=1 Tax=Paenibacillus sp. CCS19 TaxID=3158387 RepID=UPI002561E806|nr:hypothetical protein [Paenibacillus cellulosilyticus]GMK38487.1 hypothetical protein PCCS19_15410 [Paenibacillus cellulosilyticus]
MFKKITIQADERGLLFDKGSYVKKLMPGTYRLSSSLSLAIVGNSETMLTQTIYR